MDAPMKLAVILSALLVVGCAAVDAPVGAKNIAVDAFGNEVIFSEYPNCIDVTLRAEMSCRIVNDGAKEQFFDGKFN